MNILFVTWDGPQTSYLESLFLPIFAGLSKQGFRFHVLQFTWSKADQLSAARAACEKYGVGYREHAVLRRPVGAGALASAVWGKFAVQRAVRDLAINVVMPRSTLPALACILAVRPPSPIRFVFDGDGLPHDERVDFAGWSPSGLSYRILRDLEAQAVRRADAVITRTLAGRDVLMARAGAGTGAAKFHVIGNGRDEKLFRPPDAADRDILRRSLGINPAALVLVYLGSIGDQYCLAEMRNIFEKVRSARPNSRLLFLTGSPDTARRELGGEPDAGRVIVRRVDAAEVPQFLGAADVALCLRRPAFSTRAISPIKLSEYLLCGLPVVLSRGTGDVDQLPASDAIYFIDDLNERALSAAADWIAGADHAALRPRARDVGVAHFALGATVQGYNDALA